MPTRSKITSFRTLFVAFLLALIAMRTVSAAEKSGMGFKYYDKVENPGTRSAGVRGVLLYKGRFLQPVSGDIRTPIGSFTYIQSPILFEPQGWFSTQDVIVANTTDSISTEILQRGQYKGALRIGTPEDWCYLAASETWIAPHLLATNDRLNPFPFDDSSTFFSADKTPSPVNQICQLKPERGPCKALVEVFYYDANSRSCKTFFWGGCQGSVPFKTMQECQMSCEKTENQYK